MLAAIKSPRKRHLLWAGAGAVLTTWAIALYWFLVAYGRLGTPWTL